MNGTNQKAYAQDAEPMMLSMATYFAQNVLRKKLLRIQDTHIKRLNTRRIRIRQEKYNIKSGNRQEYVLYAERNLLNTGSYAMDVM